MTTDYTVRGMTCGHCVAAVIEQVGALPGVRKVEIDLTSGAVSVTSDAPLDLTAVSEAVDEAGYELVG